MLTDSYMPAQDDIAAAESKTLQPEKSNYVRKNTGEKSLHDMYTFTHRIPPVQ
jgi:hypothetical protein